MTTTLTDLIAVSWPRMSGAARRHAIATRAKKTGFVADDGNQAVDYPDAETAREAAEEYVSDGDWGDDGGHVEVYAWPLYDLNGRRVSDDTDRESYLIEIPATAPDCADGHEHEWRSPHAVLGGLVENPGVVGNGGGVIITEVCHHCAAMKVTDTWAQHNGVQGLCETRYEADDDDAREYYEARGRDAADALDDEEVEADDDSWCEGEGAIAVEAFRDRLDQRRAELSPA